MIQASGVAQGLHYHAVPNSIFFYKKQGSPHGDGQEAFQSMHGKAIWGLWLLPKNTFDSSSRNRNNSKVMQAKGEK